MPPPCCCCRYCSSRVDVAADWNSKHCLVRRQQCLLYSRSLWTSTIVIVVVTILGCLAATAALPTAVTAATISGQIISSYNYNKNISTSNNNSNPMMMCMGLDPSSSSSSSNLEANPVALVWTCDDGASALQRWIFEPVGNVFRIKIALTGGDNNNTGANAAIAMLCLTIPNGNTSTGAIATVQTCQEIDNVAVPFQLWHVTENSSNNNTGNRQLRPAHTSMCLTTTATGSSSYLVQQACSDIAAEQWLLKTTMPVIAPTLPSIWEGPWPLPMAPASAAALPNGKILLWAAYARMDYNGKGQTYITTFDPISLNSTLGLIKNTKHDMFCPGTAQLGDGRIMITGGTDSNATTLYDPSTNVWSMGPKLMIPRGYHAMTVLGDGSVFTMGGSWSGGYGTKTGEVWDVTTGMWKVKSNLMVDPTFLTKDVQGIYRSDNHMWFHAAPNGLVFHSGPSTRMHWINVTDGDGSGSIQPSVLRGDDLDAMNGNAVMYDIGKLLTLGGATSYNNSAARASAYVIDINGIEATVQRVGDMNYPRAFANSVVLPNGEVVVIGGMSHAIIFSDLNTVWAAEIWNPKTQTFSLLAEMKVPRNYHSVALLLQDGRVLAAGGGLCGNNCPANHPDTEILTPPYLLDDNGGSLVQDRPVIVEAPNTIVLGSTINVTITRMSAGPSPEQAGNNASFALVRTSVITHTVNNDQRRIPLRIVSIHDDIDNTNTIYTLFIPSNPNIVLPGYYFLFSMNSNGVPSVAKVVLRRNVIPANNGSPTSRPLSDPPTKAPSTFVPSSVPIAPTTLSPSLRADPILPSMAPTKVETDRPRTSSTQPPAGNPSLRPSSATGIPSQLPSMLPTQPPTMASPSQSPTARPSSFPSPKPTTRTRRPTSSPTPAFRAVTGLTLIDANTSEALLSLTGGNETVINLSSLNQRKVNVRAEIAGPIQSVRFEWSLGQNVTRNRPAPYLWWSPVWVPKVGLYSLTAVPFQLMKGNGVRGLSFTVTFRVSVV